MSEAEKVELENKVKLSGKKNKQEYIISALLNHKIEAVGNPLMFYNLKKSTGAYRINDRRWQRY